MAKKREQSENKAKLTEQEDTLAFINADLKMTPEEQRDMQVELDSLMQKTSFSSLSERLKPTTNKTGITIPLIVAVSLLLLSIIMVVFSQLLVNRKDQSTLVTSSNSFLSIESQLIQQIFNKTTELIREKEQEMASIQQQVQTAQQTFQSIKSGIERNVANKEQELLDTLNNELEEEKDRLKRENLSIEQIEQNVAALRKRKITAVERELQEYRTLLTQETQQQQNELQERIDSLTITLNEKEEELSVLELNIVQRKEELDTILTKNTTISELTAELERVAEDASTYEQQYKDLREAQRKTQLATDQIQKQYDTIFSTYNSNNYEKSKEQLSELSSMLNQLEPENQTLVERVQLDKQIASIMRDLLNSKQREEEQSARLLEQSKAIAETLESSDSSLKVTELQKSQIASLKKEIAQLKQSSIARDSETRRLQRKLSETESLLAKTRQLKASETISKTAIEQIRTNTIEQYNDNLDTAIRYLSGESRLRSDLSRIYTSDRTFQKNVAKMETLIEQEKEQAAASIRASNVAQSSTVNTGGEVLIGYIVRVHGSSEVSVAVLNSAVVSIGVNIVIYKLNKNSKTQIAQGVISRTESNVLVAQIERTEGLSVSKNDVVYAANK